MSRSSTSASASGQPGVPDGGACDGRLRRIASWSQRHRWAALLSWLAVLVGVTAAGQAVGADYHDDHSLPGTESQELMDIVEERAGGPMGDSVRVVVHHPGGVDASEVRPRVEEMLATLDELPRVTGVADPYGAPHTISADGTIAYATVDLDAPASEIPAGDVEELIDTARAAGGNGLQVEVGGDLVRGVEEAEGFPAEAAGMLAALVILVIMFGSFLGASLPIVTAVFAVGSTLGVIMLLSNLTTVASYTPPLMMMVGLGVGIDYALLIFARFRGELLAGRDRANAAQTALDTAGRAVMVAGCIVVIALFGLYALGLGALQGVALAVALTVLVTMAASVTLLPALLGLFGPRLQRRLERRREARQRHRPEPAPASDEGRFWRAVTGAVTRRPWAVLAATVVLLGTLALPLSGIRLGFADAGTDPESTTSRQAYDLMAEGFGPGVNGPLFVLADGVDEEFTQQFHETLDSAPGVASATPPQFMPDAGLGYAMVIPQSAPQDAQTGQLVDRLRDDVLPELAADTGGRYLVGGTTAAAADFAAVIADRMPVFLLVVVGLSTLLLVAVFRSVAIPLKAAVFNLFSIGAALGVVTAVFGDGMAGATAGPVEAFVPVLIFAIVFALSMDYEVFLVSRMHEEYRRTGDAGRALREGMARTGGVITAAASIMIVVFGAFIASPGRMLQQFGLGLAVSIFLIALVVRGLVTPAVMSLLGARAWWIPGWLDRLLPAVSVEKEAVPEPGTAGGTGARNQPVRAA